MVVGLPEDEHVGVDDEQDQDGRHPDPEHQVVLVDKRENVRADRVKTPAVPPQQRQQREYNRDGPHHTEGNDCFGLCDDAFVCHGPVDGDVAVDCSEKQTADRGGEGGDDPGQLEEENIGAVLPVEDVEIQEAVDKNDAAYQISHSQTAYEMVGRPRSKRLGVKDHTQHNEVLKHRKCTQGECQDDDRELLTWSEDHETLHVVRKVLPALCCPSTLHRAAITQQKVWYVGGENGREAIVDDLLISRDKSGEGVTNGGRVRFLKVESVLDQSWVDGRVVVAGVVGAEILDICR